MKILVCLVCFASAATLVFAQQNTNANASVAPITPADEAAIRALSKTYEQACNDKAWAKAAANFADDSIWMPPHSPKIAGRPAAEAFLRGFPPFKDLWLEPLEIQGRGDLAYVRGRYSIVGLPPGQPEQRDAGKYAEIWRKQADGRWTYLRGIFNSDLPPVAAVATATPAASARPPAAETPSVTKALPAGDIAAIRAGANALMKTINDKAWSAAAGLFSEKGIIHPPNGRAVNGRAEIETWLRAYPPTRDLRLELQEIEGRGDFAYVRGRYSIVVMPPNQPAQTDSGKFLELWRKQPDGTWKLDRDIFNSDLPIPTPASTPADALLKGAWILNVAKSRFNPGPGPRSETRTYAVTADGRQHASYDNTDADGKRTRGESTYALDGKDAPITGVSDFDAQAITRTGPRTLSALIKKDGKVVRTAVREVSEDGQTLTLRFKGTNAKGQPLDDTWMFDRARTAGEWLSLRFTTVKPDMVAEFERLQKEELIPALKKAGVTRRGASSPATFGEGYVYAFGQPLRNLAELDEEEPLVKALGAAGASALLAKLRACHVTTRVLGIRNVTDLSWDHAQPLPMFVVTRHELAPGRKAEWLAFMREHLVPAVRKSGVKQYVVQETVFGGNANEVYTLSFMERYGDLDAGGLRRQLGDDAYATLVAKLPAGVVVHTERFVVRTRPELSILPAAKP